MDYIKNKSKLSITPQIYNDYINLIIDEIFKLLPIYEGKNKDGIITFSKGQAYYHFLIDLENMIIEIRGSHNVFMDNSKFLQLLIILEGMKNIKIDEHAKLKNIVFKCIKICEDMRIPV